MQKPIKIKIPEIPTGIRVGRETLKISDFTVEELQEIGEIWTKNLIKEKLNPIKKEQFLPHIKRSTE